MQKLKFKESTKKETRWSSRVYLTNENNFLLKEREEKNFDIEHHADQLATAAIPFPQNCLVELTSACNHSCVFCANPRTKRKSRNLDKEFFRRFVKDAVDLGLREVGFYTTGEPLVRRDLEDFIQISSEAGITYIYITTNGALANIKRMKKLIDLGLNSVKFSINAATKETYRLIHGKDDFQAVVENIKDLKEYRDAHAPHVHLTGSFVTTNFSDSEIDLWKKNILPYFDDAKIMGVHGQMGQAIEQMKLLESKFSTTYPELGQAKPCHMLWDRITLTQEGFLSLCCVDYENSLTYADLNKTPLKEAWNNDIMQNMRSKHLDQELNGTQCHNCVYGVSEKFEPISDIREENNIKNNERGEKSVTDRITQLSLRGKS